MLQRAFLSVANHLESRQVDVFRADNDCTFAALKPTRLLDCLILVKQGNYAKFKAELGHSFKSCSAALEVLDPSNVPAYY